VPNLYVVQSAANPSPRREKSQTEFEKKFVQVKVDSNGQPLHPHATATDGELILATNKKTMSNADLCHRVGVEGGKVEDCGRFKPLSVSESLELGLVGFETQVPEEIEPSDAEA
jgi:hypothetical protein